MVADAERSGGKTVGLGRSGGTRRPTNTITAARAPASAGTRNVRRSPSALEVAAGVVADSPRRLPVPRLDAPHRAPSAEANLHRVSDGA